MAGDNSLALLSNLLHPPEEDTGDQDEPEGAIISPYSNPGAIGPPKTKKQGLLNESIKQNNNKSDIWNIEEVPDATEIAFDDHRPEPQYEMVFKQSVTPEDMFLGMTNKTPLTSACENLFLRISLPNTQYKDVDLVVTSKHIDCQTPVHHLGLYLPHTVDPKSGKARWLSDEHVLELTLKIVREYDFLNN